MMRLLSPILRAKQWNPKQLLPAGYIVRVQCGICKAGGDTHKIYLEQLCGQSHFFRQSLFVNMDSGKVQLCGGSWHSWLLT
jgi:hypothetical protein